MENWAEVWNHQLGAGVAGLVFLGMSVTLGKLAKAADGVNKLGYLVLTVPCVVATAIFGVRSLWLAV